MEYKKPENPSDRKKYYADNGYILYPGLIDSSMCDRAIQAFADEVKPYRGYLYRQASADPEKHKFTSAGSILNSLLNPVSVNGGKFPGFRRISHALLSQDTLFAAVEELMGEPAAIAQSMYFEGNPATWAHQDCYYLDSDREGSMIGAWVALEDIAVAAGRFYVAPASHLIEMPRNADEFNIALNHNKYKSLVLDIIEKYKLELRAPILKKGDVLFWNSRTIHGAFTPQDHAFTRNSYTAHFIPASGKLLQYQCVARELDYSYVNNHRIALIKDQNIFWNRLSFLLEQTFPAVIKTLKHYIISKKIEACALRK